MKRTLVIRAVTAVVVTVFVLGTWFQDGRLDLSPIKFFSAAVFICTIGYLLWDIWIWRIPIVQKIPTVPRSIRGTWKGTLSSFWVNPETDERPAPKTVYLMVRQTASVVSVKLYTDESRSTSAIANIAEADGAIVLSYLYLNKPDLRFEARSHMHHGSTVFDVSGNPARLLKGRYWTDRDSKGELEFTQRSKSLADDYAEAAALFT
ncbi:Cap15 family cyclic dinucleotide receptor domain-containing protein [Glycomyces halotolerans]